MEQSNTGGYGMDDDDIDELVMLRSERKVQLLGTNTFTLRLSICSLHTLQLMSLLTHSGQNICPQGNTAFAFLSSQITHVLKF